ncbi:phage baseplate assembly protein V [Klebsiella quasipneumoniae]
MAVKAKRFRIGVEGATTDGRNIERAWLEQMAASYDPQVYTALINLEHIKGYTPDSPFRRFGTVDKLEAEEIADGPLKGKLALYAWITPSEDLVAYTRNLQKLFTSMEVNTSFADTGKAYLVGGWFEYDPATGRWIIRGVKSVLIESSQVVSCKTGEFVIEADTTRINSNVILNGDVTHGGGAMTSNGVVADRHKHPGDSGGTTGDPF